MQNFERWTLSVSCIHASYFVPFRDLNCLKHNYVNFFSCEAVSQIVCSGAIAYDVYNFGNVIKVTNFVKQCTVEEILVFSFFPWKFGTKNVLLLHLLLSTVCIPQFSLVCVQKIPLSCKASEKKWFWYTAVPYWRQLNRNHLYNLRVQLLNILLSYGYQLEKIKSNVKL